MTKNIKTRWESEGIHYKAYGDKKQRPFWNAICKYGWDNFDHVIILDSLSKEEAIEKERYYIELWKTRENGYNVAKGGEGGIIYKEHPKGMKGKKHTEEWSKKHSEDIKRAAVKGKYKNMWTDKEHPKGMKGKKQTTKQKEACSNGIVAIVMPSGYVHVSISIKTASKELNISERILYRLEKQKIPYEAPNNFKQYSYLNGMRVFLLD